MMNFVKCKTYYPYLEILYLIVASLFLATCHADTGSCSPCSEVPFRGSLACECNETYCDFISIPDEIKNNQLISYTTSKDGGRLCKNISYFQNQSDSSCGSCEVTLTIDSCDIYQTICGFGGALTDAAGYNIMSLKDGARNNLLQSYFSKKGSNYSLIRVPIGGTDFSDHCYTYSDTCDVLEQLIGLTDNTCSVSFNLAMEDYTYKMPIIKLAKSINTLLRLMGCAWRAPQKFLLGAPVKMIIKPECYEAWALYHIKFLEAYCNYGICFDYLSTGNEIDTALQSVSWTPETHQLYINSFLCPLLKKFGFGRTNLVFLDDIAQAITTWQTILEDKTSYECLAGIATHFYLDFLNTSEFRESFHYRYKDKILVATEAAFCVLLGNEEQTTPWDRGVKYAQNIFLNLLHWACGWIDWNLAVDLQQGPTWAHNYCDAAIVVDIDGNKFYKQYAVYFISHFSTFVDPGSVRIGINVRSNGDMSNLQVIGFKTSDCRRIVIVILNTDCVSHEICVCRENNQCAKIISPANSIMTTISTA